MKKIKILFFAFTFPVLIEPYIFCEELTPEQACELAATNNISYKLAGLKSEKEKDAVLQSAARLLPSVEAYASQSRTFKENLSAIGFDIAGQDPTMAGPFNTFNAGLKLTENIFNLSLTEKEKTAEENAAIFSMMKELALTQVEAAALVSYFDAFRALKRIEVSLSEEKLALELYQLARDKYEAGTAAMIDVTRAESNLAQAHMKVTESRAAYEQSLLNLKHIIRFPLGEPLTLKNSSSLPKPDMSEEEAVKSALTKRIEIKIQRARVKSQEHALKAQKNEALPNFLITAETAYSGNQLDSKARLVGDAGIMMRVPLFEGGLISASCAAKDKELKMENEQLSDTMTQIEKEARISLLRVKEAIDNIAAAEKILKLAKEEVEMAKDRFSSGVGDNLELTAAQTQLSKADDIYIESILNADIRAVNFFLSTGRMENLIKEIKNGK